MFDCPILCFNAYMGASFSGRITIPQTDFLLPKPRLSSTDNVPFGGTLRIVITLLPPLYSTPEKKASVYNKKGNISLAFPQNRDMGLIFIRTVIIFVTLLIVMRLMGKRQIGEMQPYELVITLLISELACIPMADNSIPLLYGIIAILAIYFVHQIVCLIDLNARSVKTVLSGSPSIVLNKNGIDDTQLKKNNLDVSDLIESLRVKGFFSLDAVDYALYEAEGMFSALPKKDYEQKQTSLPIIIVDEGKFDQKNIEQTGKTQAYYLDVLEKHHCPDLKKVLVMTVDGDGKVYLQSAGEKYQVFHLRWEEKLW